MKIKSDRETLIKGIQSIQSNVSSKIGAITILQNFLMETENGFLKLVFTDLEMAVKHYIKVSIDTEGSITMPLKKFMDIVHVLNPEEEINLSVDRSNKVSIVSGKSRFNLGGMPKSEYPVIPDAEEANSFEIPVKKLAEYISKTIFSASTENERQFLNGLLFKNEKGWFSIVATDGKRLSLIEDGSLGVKNSFKAIVPSKVLGEIVKFISISDPGKDQKAVVNLSSNQVTFKIGKTLFISKLLDSNFPDYEQIIPKSSQFSVKIDSEKMLGLTRRAMVCVNDRTGFIKYIFKKNVLIAQSSSPNMDFEDEVDIEYKDKEMAISFKPKYILDVLRNTSGVLEFKINNPGMPVLIRAEKDRNFTHIVMPLRS